MFLQLKKIKAKINNHQAGQFTRIGLKVNDDFITRSYSYASAPKDEILEIANTNEKNYPTSHGVVNIDYTKEEYLVNKIMYYDDYTYLISLKTITGLILDKDSSTTFG